MREDRVCTEVSGKGDAVPLSDHEQRILQEIERTFYERDPDFAHRVRSETVYRHAGRNCKWSALAFVGGLALLVTTFSMSAFLGTLGFVVMFISAVIFEQNLRRLGRAGLADLSQSAKGKQVSTDFGDLRRRLGEKFKRPGS